MCEAPTFRRKPGELAEFSIQVLTKLETISDSEDKMNSPDPAEQTQNPMSAMPALAHAASERKPGVASSVLQRIRDTQPRSSRLPDAAFRVLILLTAVSVFAIVVFVVVELVDKSRLSLHQFGLGFFFGHDWDPVNDQYGAMPFIYGTLVSSFLALLLAVPLSVGVAVYVTEMCPMRLRAIISFLVELLAAIPSVIYGLWAIFVLAPLLRDYVEPFLAKTLGWTGLFTGPIYGLGMLAAGIILAIMIVPIIASITREVLTAVPQNQREAVLALGATRWEMIRMGVLRNARIGIVGGVILGLGRALGETMAVTMVIGNRPEVAKSLFAPGYTMASVIANEFSEATGDLYLSALVEIGLALFIVTLIVNALARLLVWSITGGTAGRARA
jgi:phosphate transport system permease protein